MRTKTQDPAISFVIPAFNCESTIKEAVESITESNFCSGDEIIIVNDGSTDNTEKILNKLVNVHNNIKVINNRVNRGCPASRNVGISLATNPLIFNLDSDNVLVPDSVAKLKKYFIENQADIAAFGSTHFFKVSTRDITHRWIYPPGQMTLSDFLASTFNAGSGGNFLFSKKSWLNVGKYWEWGAGLDEAWGFTLKQLANGAKFFILPGSYYYHRHGHESLYVRESRNLNGKTAMATKMIKPFMNLLCEEDRKYILSKDGRCTWIHHLNEHPVRTVSKEQGRSGIMVMTSPSKFRKVLKNVLPARERSDEITRLITLTYKWLANELKLKSPPEHTHISSDSLFFSIVSSFIPINYINLTPNNWLKELRNYRTKSLSYINPSIMKSSIDLELNTVDKLKSLISNQGMLMFAVPIDGGGPENSDYLKVVNRLKGFKLTKLDLVTRYKRNPEIVHFASKEMVDSLDSKALGCFTFVKNLPR
jgi:glycosyltransferase involved in cell wall biosynthesis